MAKIEHFPFLGMMVGKELNNDNMQIEKNINLSIVTSFTDKDKAILVKQLEENNIDYINAAEGVDKFIKAFKPIYYAEALKNVDSEYVLIIDSYDTILHNIDEIPSCLETYGKDMVYSSWKTHFPTYFDIDFSVPQDNEKKYLNSGVFFGKTSAVKEFYNELSNYIKAEYETSNEWLKDFEQYWIYKFLSENDGYLDKLGIDYKEELVENKNI